MVTLCPSFAKGSSESARSDESMLPVQHLLVAALVIAHELEPDMSSGRKYANETEALLDTADGDLLGHYRAAVPS